MNYLSSVLSLSSDITTGVSSVVEEMQEAVNEPEISNLFVVLMGIGVVFFGLLCIVFLIKIMSAVMSKGSKKGKSGKNEVTAAKGANTNTSVNVPKSAEVGKANITAEEVAAISSAIAEENGVNVSAVKILSVKKV